MRVSLRRNPWLVLLLLSALLNTAEPQSKAAQIDAIVQRYNKEGLFQGSVLVADHAKVIYRKAVGLANAEWNMPNTPDTRFRLGSVTKQFTAMLILQLVDEGKLRLDGTIGDYLPEYPEGPGRAVTIHQLLTHSSGIPSYTSNPRFFPEESRNPARPTELIKRFWSLPLDYAPGTRFQYNNSGYFLLGVIIERLTGVSYAEALQKRILDPLGLKNTGYDQSVPLLPRRAAAYSIGFDGMENAAYLDMSLPFSAGALYSTVDDLWAWDQALAAHKLLSEESYGKYESPEIEEDNFGHYGYGWFIERVARGAGHDSVTAIHHGGSINGFIAMNFRVPEDGIVIITLDNAEQLTPVYRNILQALYGLPVQYAHPSIARVIAPIAKASGGAAAVASYRSLKAKDSTAYQFSEDDMNLLGYHLLQRGRASDAVAIFKLNAEEHPDSWNAYDSLGEALLASGDTTAATASYRKSVTMNPRNTSGAEVLKRIEAP